MSPLRHDPSVTFVLVTSIQHVRCAAVLNILGFLHWRDNSIHGKKKLLVSSFSKSISAGLWHFHEVCLVSWIFSLESISPNTVGSDRKNPWNQTLGNLWENSILIFCNVKNLPIFANFEHFFPSNSILLIFWIEWMFPKCSQILVPVSYTHLTLPTTPYV